MKEESSNIINLKTANKKARKKDFENDEILSNLEHFGVPQEQIEQAMKVLSMATGNKELYIGTKRSPQSKVRFAQVLQENYDYLREIDYFTSKEKTFLLDLVSFIAFNSNCIVDDVKSKNPVPLNISELAKRIKLTRANTSLSVNSLVK
ncbi:hypothetical protein, partial [Streptomyces sp. NPDC003631]